METTNNPAEGAFDPIEFPVPAVEIDTNDPRWVTAVEKANRSLVSMVKQENGTFTYCGGDPDFDEGISCFGEGNSKEEAIDSVRRRLAQLFFLSQD